MKEMACNQLGGACDKMFRAETFDEIAALSKEHGMEMFRIGDEAHLQAMNEMKKLMEISDDMNQWFEAKRKEFDNLPEI